jgi:hypothetical protein
MVLQPDGSSLIGGYYIDELGYTSALVAKTVVDGNLAPCFGTGGIALFLTDGARITDLGVLSNGSMVATAARVRWNMNRPSIRYPQRGSSAPCGPINCAQAQQVQPVPCVAQ